MALANDDRGYFWWHSIRFPDGTVTPGEKYPELLEQEWHQLALPSLLGLRVLDIGAWDGWFSFAAERAGAAEVVALDQFVWSLDFSRSPEYWEYVADCRRAGRRPDEWGPGCAWWDSRALMGKRSFDLARKMLGSGVRDVVADFMTADLDRLGTFDVVFFLGVLYHMREPLTALTRLKAVTRELAVIETAAIERPDQDNPLVEFDGEGRVNGDTTNWWFPNEAAVHALLRAAGFASSQTVARSAFDHRRPGVTDYRLTVHARP